MYTMNDVIELTGFSAPKLMSALKRLNIKPSAEKAKKQFAITEDEKNAIISLLTTPAPKELTKVGDIADILGATRTTVQKYISELGIKMLSKRYGDDPGQTWYIYTSDWKQFRELLEDKLNHSDSIAKHSCSKIPNLSDFPSFEEITPMCFQNLESDEELFKEMKETDMAIEKRIAAEVKTA